MITRPVRLYENALRGVRYVFGEPVPFPLRARFEKDEAHQAAVAAHREAKLAAEFEEQIIAERRRAA